jgi:hypothetical protein
MLPGQPSMGVNTLSAFVEHRLQECGGVPIARLYSEHPAADHLGMQVVAVRVKQVCGSHELVEEISR